MDDRNQLISRLREYIGNGSPSSERHSHSQMLDVIRQLENFGDIEVLRVFLELFADPMQYDLARIEVLEIVKSWGMSNPAWHNQVGKALLHVVRTERDKNVRNHAIAAMSEYMDVPGALQAIAGLVASTQEDTDARHNALFAVERFGPNPETRKVLKELRTDDELNSAASRVLNKWAIH